MKIHTAGINVPEAAGNALTKASIATAAANMFGLKLPPLPITNCAKKEGEPVTARLLLSVIKICVTQTSRLLFCKLGIFYRTLADCDNIYQHAYASFRNQIGNGISNLNSGLYCSAA